MITIQQKTPDTLSFQVKDISVANTLRMIMMSEVETLAIHKIYFERNNSPLCDELIAHRLGLVVMDSRAIDEVDDEEEQELLTVELDVVCDDDEMYVTPAMFKCSNDKVRPIHLNTPLVRLTRGQRLKLVGVIQKGNGRKHAKWVPMTLDHWSINAGKVDITIESVGSLNAPDILIRALKVFKRKLGQLRESLE